MQRQLSCMCCVAVVPMSNMGPPCTKRGLLCPSAMQMCSCCERITWLCYGLNIFFCRPMAGLSGRVLPNLWSNLPLGARLLPMLVQARWFCLTKTIKPSKMMGHLCSEELSPGYLYSLGFFFSLKSQCYSSNSLQPAFYERKGEGKNRPEERSKN